MIKYKYKKRENKFTENGHTMFEEDVLQRLNRLAYLEEQIKKGKLLNIQRVMVELPNFELFVNCDKELKSPEIKRGACDEFESN